MRRVEVVRTYLELVGRDGLQPAPPPAGPVRVARAHDCAPWFFRWLYAEVGRRYHWRDRLAWTDAELRARLDDPSVSLHVLTWDGAPAGYFELQRHADASVEIAYFGLLPAFLGRGLGRYLLTRAVEAAWETGSNRVWLHTCTLDDPAALPNYLSRGFRVFKTESYTAQLPE